MRPEFLTLIMVVVLISGCSEPKKKVVSKEVPKPVVQLVDNTQLAKVILRPKQKISNL